MEIFTKRYRLSVKIIYAVEHINVFVIIGKNLMVNSNNYPSQFGVQGNPISINVFTKQMYIIHVENGNSLPPTTCRHWFILSVYVASGAIHQL